MAERTSMTDRIAGMQDYSSTASSTGRARSRTTSARPRAPAGHAQRVPARLRHDPSYGQKSTSTTRRGSSATTSSRTSSTAGRDAIFGLDIPLMRLVNVLQARRQGYGTERRVILLHGPVGLVEVDHRPPAQAGHRGVLAHARGRALHLRLGRPAEGAGPSSRQRREIASRARCTRSRCGSSRRSGASKAFARARALEPTVSRSTSRATSTRRAASSSAS